MERMMNDPSPASSSLSPSAVVHDGGGVVSKSVPTTPLRSANKKFKIVFIGNEKVGKTSILSRFMTDEFSKEYEATIGTDYLTKTVTYGHKVTQQQQQQQQQEAIQAPNNDEKTDAATSSDEMTKKPTGGEEVTPASPTVTSTKTPGGGDSTTLLHAGLPPLSVRLQLWDTAGKDRFRSMIPQYLRDCSIAVVVYDVTDRSSFAAAVPWIELVRTERSGVADGEDGTLNANNINGNGDAPERPPCMIFLIAHKVDAGSSLRTVSSKDGLQLAEEQSCVYMECSAKAGYNVRTLFRKLAAALYLREIRPSIIATEQRHAQSRRGSFW